MMGNLKKDENFKNMTHFLDVGVGTGRPLFEVLKEMPEQT